MRLTISIFRALIVFAAVVLLPARWMQAAPRGRAAKLKPGAWLVGHGYDDTLLAEMRHPKPPGRLLGFSLVSMPVANMAPCRGSFSSFETSSPANPVRLAE